jgi:hypothetical protein
MRQAILVATLGASVVLGGCSRAGGGARWEGTVTDSAGIQLVKNPATGMWRPDDQWTVREALRIGTAEGEPEYQFGALLPAGSIAIASDGRIVVFDSQGRHLKVFTAAGQYERTIGGPGGGPGEIGQGAQSSILMTPGDTIFLNDFGNQRVNLYLMDGTFVRSFPLDLASGFPLRMEVASDGRVLAQMRKLNFTGAGPTDSLDAIAVFRLDGTVGDTVMRVPSGKTISFTGGMPEWRLFVPEPIWALWGDKILHAVNNAYRIGAYGADGSLERVLEMPFTLNPVTEADQNTIRGAFEKIFKEQGVPAQFAQQLMTRVHFAPEFPAFAQILSGPDNSILVQLIQPISTLTPEEREGFDLMAGSLGSRRWDVFDDQGRYLGVLEMPLKFAPVRFRGDKIYGIQRDDLDVQYVVVLEVVKPGDDS